MILPIYIPRCEQTIYERALPFKDHYLAWKQNMDQCSHHVSSQAFLTACCVSGIAAALFTGVTVYVLAPEAKLMTYAVSLMLSVPPGIAVGAIAKSIMNPSEAQI